MTANLQKLVSFCSRFFSAKTFFTIAFFTIASTLYAQTDVEVGDAFAHSNLNEGFTVPLYRTGNPSTGQPIYSRHFFVYSQDDLCTAKLSPGATISKIAWFKGSVGSSDGATHSFKIYMKNTDIISRNGDTWTNLTEGATKVYENEALVIPNVDGWWELVLTTPFIYTGETIEVYTDWFAGGGPNGSRTNGRIQFAQTRRSGGIDAIRLSGGAAKFSPFDDAEFVGGGIFTSNVTSDLVNVRFTQTGGTPRAEICNNGIDDNCDGQIDEGCPVDYASKQTGFWNTTTTWQRFLFGPVNGWVNALVPPATRDRTIQIVNTHIVTVNTFVEADQITINAGGRLKISTPGVLSLSNGTGDDLINKGTLELTISSNLTGAGNFVNEGVTTVTDAILQPVTTLNKGTITFTGDNFCQILDNSGTVNWKSGKHNTGGNGTFTNNNTGLFVIASDNIFGSADVINNGTFRKTTSGTTTFASSVTNTGKIEGVGTIQFDGGINNMGSIDPGGTGVGQLTLNATNGLLSATSTVNIGIANTMGAGIGNDLLVRDGNLFLQGKLTVTEVGDVPGGNYEIIRLTSGSFSGSFSQITMPTGYTIQVNANSVVVTKPIIRFPGSGNALSFNGVNAIGAVSHNNNYNFSIGQNFTVDFWVKVPVADQPDLSFTSNVIAEKWGSPWTAHPFSISVGNSQSAFPGRILFTRDNSADGSGYFGLVSNVAINDDRFHHIAIQKDGATLRIFTDGIATGTVSDKTTGETVNTANLHIGSSQDLSSSFKGDLDELRIWNTALSVDQIRTWMCKKITNTHPLFANLVSYFPFDQVTGNTSIIDNKGTNNGSLFNSAAYVLSGAAIGEESAFDYSIQPTASISLPNGEKLSATSVPNNLQGIHVYVVKTTPNTNNGITGPGLNDRYFGVFPAGSASPQYNAVYDYSGNPFVASEDALTLFKRNSNSVSTWEPVSGTLNTAANTITFSGTFTEYMLGNLGGTLPLQLLSFSGSKKINNALLQWRTSNEINVARFEIQRSLDGRNFVTVGQVFPGGNSYSFMDANIFISCNLAYYRLKSVDADGHSTYSNIIKLSGEQYSKFSVLPNPVKDVVTITGLKENGTISLRNTTGQILHQQIVTDQTISINMTKYPAGTYLLQYIYKSEVINQKVIKQ